MGRIAGVVLAVLLIGGVVAAVVAGRSNEDKATATKTVRMVIGSERAEFFADPDVVKALAAKGYTVKAETSGSWAMEGLDLKGYDLAFPSSQAPAAALAGKYEVRGTLPRPFCSPLVVVAHRGTAGVLAGNGLATLDEKNRGTLRMAACLDAAGHDRTWQQLKGADEYGELTGTPYISSTDPETSDSGALYLAAASCVANGGKVVAGDAEVERAAPLLRKLVGVQGAQQSSTDAAFRDFVSGAGNPLVLVYESQVAALLDEQPNPDDLVVLSPDTTVNSDHTAVPLTENGRGLAELLSGDPQLRRLAVRHGFRPQGDPAELAAAAASRTAYLKQQLTGVRQAPVPTSAVLHELARRARGRGGEHHVSTTENDFTLTPPEAVAPVPREKAGGLVPVDDGVRTDMAAKAAAYVEGLAALDARSPEFAGEVGEITALGAGEMRTATAQSNRMLERTVRSLPGKGGDARSQVAGSLVELRRVVEDLDWRATASVG